jgi:hypothetical protein
MPNRRPVPCPRVGLPTRSTNPSRRAATLLAIQALPPRLSMALTPHAFFAPRAAPSLPTIPPAPAPRAAVATQPGVRPSPPNRLPRAMSRQLSPARLAIGCPIHMPRRACCSPSPSDSSPLSCTIAGSTHFNPFPTTQPYVPLVFASSPSDPTFRPTCLARRSTPHASRQPHDHDHPCLPGSGAILPGPIPSV